MKNSTTLEAPRDAREEFRDLASVTPHPVTPIHTPEALEDVLDRMSREDLEEIAQYAFRGLWQEIDPELGTEILNPAKVVNTVGYVSSMKHVFERLGMQPDPY